MMSISINDLFQEQFLIEISIILKGFSNEMIYFKHLRLVCTKYLPIDNTYKFNANKSNLTLKMRSSLFEQC